MTALRKTKYKRPPGRTECMTLLELFRVIDELGYTYPSLEKKARVRTSSLGRWRGAKINPSVAKVESVAKAMGYRLVMVPIDLTPPSS